MHVFASVIHTIVFVVLFEVKMSMEPAGDPEFTEPGEFEYIFMSPCVWRAILRVRKNCHKLHTRPNVQAQMCNNAWRQIPRPWITLKMRVETTRNPKPSRRLQSRHLQAVTVGAALDECFLYIKALRWMFVCVNRSTQMNVCVWIKALKWMFVYESKWLRWMFACESKHSNEYLCMNQSDSDECLRVNQSTQMNVCVWIEALKWIFTCESKYAGVWWMSWFRLTNRSISFVLCVKAEFNLCVKSNLCYQLAELNS